MTSRTLIVGGLSPLGRAIGAEFDSRGWDTTRTSRSGELGSIAFDVLDGDDAELLETTHPDAVIYLANPEPHGDVHDLRAVGALASFVRSCAVHRVRRVVFASSAAVYGTESPVPHSETDDPAPASEYGRRKLESERALHEMSTAGTDIVIARIFNVFGPGFDGSLVNRLAVPGETTPVVYDSEDFVRDYIHSFDVARAMAAALEAKDAAASIVNVGSGKATSNRILLDLLPSTGPERFVRDDRPVHSYSVADIKRARALWGFEARVMVEDALADPASFLTG